MEPHNADIDNDDFMSDKKPNFPVVEKLREYLNENDRSTTLPVRYRDLLRYLSAIPLYNKDGSDSLWESLLYDASTHNELNSGLCQIYALLKTAGEMTVMEHLYVDRIDYCTFGNSNPFRIRIVNQFNDNYDYFYVKKADSSRIYGLELEHILSPNRMNYLVDHQTLVEEHIAGIPGDLFISEYMKLPNFNEVRLAKEFIKFNERSFVRLLGDMRSYNYVIDVTPDFEAEQYRIRAIDFDQQCFEGRKTLYLPQYFKDNNPIVELCILRMTRETVKQYQYEERTLISRRMYSSRHKLLDLLDCMESETLSTPDRIERLKKELNKHHKCDDFTTCATMGQIVRTQLKLMMKTIERHNILGDQSFKN